MADVTPINKQEITVPDELETLLVKGASQHHVITINGRKLQGYDGKSIHNALVLTERDAKTKDFIAFDVFQYKVYFTRCPPWESEKTFFPHPVLECDLLNFRAWLETRGIKINAKDADDILLSLAQRNVVNPPKEYFESLVWDHVTRLDTWLINACDAQDDPRYLALVGSKWPMGAVARVYDPGCKFDSTLILEGKQGWEKSKAFEMLSTINGVKYFLDEAIRVSDKDSLMKLQGKLIFEMSELATLQRGGETEEMKAFQSRRDDTYREPYSRKIITRKRMFAIGGTINPIGGYLTDPTGARRYWPVECGCHLDIEWLEANKTQLWAEAVHRYKQGERIWLIDDEIDLADIEQRKRFKQAINHDSIIKAIKSTETTAIGHGKWHFSVEDVMAQMCIEQVDKKNYVINNQIKDTLVYYGYTTCRPREVIGGEKIRGERWIHEGNKKKRPVISQPSLLEDPIEF